MATILQEAPIVAARPKPMPASWNVNQIMPWLVLAVSVGLAVPIYAQFWEHPRDIWYGVVHDRNTHYCHGLDLGMDLRYANLPGMLHHLDALRMWGPLYAVLLAPVQAIFGPDYRLGVLPSWLAWIGASMLGFLLARRMVSIGGNIAGLTAALFILASPGHRAFAVDIMLESLGACLSLWCLYQYVVAVQDDRPRRGIWLGVALTVLFLDKTNYWMLMLFGLSASELARQPGVYWNTCRDILSRWQARAWLVRQLRHPLTYLLLALTGLAVWITINGGSSFTLAGREISLAKAANATLLAYMVLFIRVVQWWRTPAVRAGWQALPRVFRQAVGLHGWAVAIYFLFPQRLANFIWYMSFNNNDQHRESHGFLHGAPYYVQAMFDDYYVAGWALVTALALALAAVASWRSWRPGAGVVLWFLGISALLTFQHPMLKNRFLHSWIAAEWVLAGVGLVGVIGLLRLSATKTRVCGIVALLGLTALHSPFLFAPGHAGEGGLNDRQPCVLPLVEAYLPHLEDARAPTMVSNMPIRDLQAWTYQETFARQSFSTDIKKLGADPRSDKSIMGQWLKTTNSDRLVVVEIYDDSAYFAKTLENRDLTPLREFMAGQTVFEQVADEVLPQRVRITVWARRVVF